MNEDIKMMTDRLDRIQADLNLARQILGQLQSIAKEPTIEELRKERPWKDVDVGEVVNSLSRAALLGGWQTQCTESLSPLALEFARIVQYENGDWVFTKSVAGWIAWPFPEEDSIRISFQKTSVRWEFHRLHYAKDEATIRRAVEIFTEERFKKMMGVKP